MSDETPTPTTDEVRSDYQWGVHACNCCAELKQEDADAFDRWFRSIQAKAVRDAAEMLDAEFQSIPAWTRAHRAGVRTHEWMDGGVQMVTGAVDMLRSHADRLLRAAAGVQGDAKLSGNPAPQGDPFAVDDGIEYGVRWIKTEGQPVTDVGADPANIAELVQEWNGWAEAVERRVAPWVVSQAADHEIEGQEHA